jgi:hypothetical protein
MFRPFFAMLMPAAEIVAGKFNKQILNSYTTNVSGFDLTKIYKVLSTLYL